MGWFQEAKSRNSGRHASNAGMYAAFAFNHYKNMMECRARSELASIPKVIRQHEREAADEQAQLWRRRDQMWDSEIESEHALEEEGRHARVARFFS